jgi:hypothetical protein
MRAVAALLVLGALLACARRDEGPSLDRQWTKVVELSRPRVTAADPALLQKAIAAIVPRREALRAALAAGPPPPLSPDEAAALDALAAWYAARGGLPRRTCADQAEASRQVLAAVTLAELALATAPPDAAAARLDAVLYLGHRLRQEGVNLLDISAGSEIADKAIRWAGEHELAPTPASRELAPGPELLPRALAAEAQCMVELARQPGEVRLARAELDGLRRFYLDTLADLERGGSDADLVARLSARAAEAQADRGHPTLAVLIPSLGRTAERLLEQRRRYHGFLDGIR